MWLYFTFLLEWRKRSSSNNEGLVDKADRAIEREKVVGTDEFSRGDSKCSQEVDEVERHDFTL